MVGAAEDGGCVSVAYPLGGVAEDGGRLSVEYS